MAIFKRNSLVIFLRMLTIFISINELFYTDFLSAAPILVQEGAVTQSSTSAWFEDANASITFEGLTTENTFNQLPSDRENLDDPAYKPTNNTVKKYLPKKKNFVSLEDGEYREENSLKHLLRSYLNASPSSANGLTTRSQSIQSDGSVIFLDESSGNNEFIAATKTAAEDFLAKTVNFVLQPGVSENNLMTFSVFGFGEFAFLSGKDGLFLSFGDRYISFFGNNFEAGASVGSGIEYSGISTGTNGAINNAPANADSSGSPTHTAYYESKDQDDSDETLKGEGQNYSKGPRYRRMFDLVLDVLTYPITLIIILGCLLFNFVKSKGGFRIKKSRQRSSHSKHQKARAYRKRNAENAAPTINRDT